MLQLSIQIRLQARNVRLNKYVFNRDLKDWTDPDARTAAGRLLQRLGAAEAKPRSPLVFSIWPDGHIVGESSLNSVAFQTTSLTFVLS